MTLYRVCGLTIASDRRLPELPPAPHGTPDWTVRTAPTRTSRPRWFRHTYLANGQRWLSIAGERDRYTLRFARLVTFDVESPDRVIRCMPAAGTARATVRHLLLDQVLPLVAGSAERLALHASAVVSPAGAVAFAGPAGRGKSTMAALLAHAGWPLLCDDCLLLERRRAGMFAMPGYPGVRLFPDAVRALLGAPGRKFARVASYTSKRRIAAVMPSADAGAPLRRLYIIGSPISRGRQAVVITDRGPRQAMVDVIESVLCLDHRDRMRTSEAFDLAAAIVERTAVRRIRCAAGLERMDEIRDALIADIMGEPAVSGANRR